MKKNKKLILQITLFSSFLNNISCNEFKLKYEFLNKTATDIAHNCNKKTVLKLSLGIVFTLTIIKLLYNNSIPKNTKEIMLHKKNTNNDSFLDLLNQAIEMRKNQLTNSININKIIDQTANYDFTNYFGIIEKINIVEKTAIYCTDIHEANISDFLIEKLKTNFLLEKEEKEQDKQKNKNNKIYKLKENTIIIFGGDYWDKSDGKYAYATFQFILNLYLNNVNNVYLIRGNHENINSFSKKVKKAHKAIINNFYNLMNSALFLENNNKKFIMISHAAIEPLFIEDIKNFLTENTNLQILDSILNKDKKYKKTNGFFWGDYQLDSTNKWKQIEPNILITENYYKQILEDINKNSNFELLATLSGHQHGGGNDNSLMKELNLNKNYNYISYFSDKKKQNNINSTAYNIIEKNTLIKGSPCFLSNNFNNFFKNKKFTFCKLTCDQNENFEKSEI